jgi:uncharacterized protein YjiK
MTNSTKLNEKSFSLTYLDQFEIKNETEELNEPSGLTLSHGNNTLWTVSDDTNKIFNLSLDGKLRKEESFEIKDDGLEGIVLDPTGEFFFVVKENSNEIIKIKVDKPKSARNQRLDKMAGFYTVANYFAGGEPNKGLEGITWNNKTGTIFVIKERDPGLLVELSSDLKRIQSHQLLNDKNGFRDNEVGPDDLDFSDICYDESRDCFWIISDKASRLFLYDWKKNKVLQSSKLRYRKNGKQQEIEKAEGVEIDLDTNRLYVVSDKEARLYVFDIHE